MLDLYAIMGHLKDVRPVFHSEADFQHSLAWELQKRHKNTQIRLEKPFIMNGSVIYVDIVVIENGVTVGIELKYLTSKYQTTIGDETFSLKNQSANDVRRYDFLYDVQRLEYLKSQRQIDVGIALLLTNDRGYWNRTVRDTMDKAFRLHDQRTATGELAWKPTASPGTTHNRENPLVLSNEYTCNWHDYQEEYSRFRYLLFRVDR